MTSWGRRLLDADGFVSIRVSEHHAQKQHGACCFCARPIHPGQRYTVYVGMIDFQFSMLKHHAHKCGAE